MYVLRRLFQGKQMRKVFVERLTEPIHLNLLSAFVALFGSYRMKVALDLVIRQQYAFPILYAADEAKRYGYKEVTLVELGVASGAGLMNMCRIAKRTTNATGIDFHIVGFDGGVGMPPAIDYRDLPEIFQEGDYPMVSPERLKEALPSNAQIIIGDVAETARAFIETLTEEAPLGFVAVDVDYYSSTKAALPILLGLDPKAYMPIVPVYLDDIGIDGSNPWTGELLAVREFNDENELRKIAPFTLLRSQRVFKNTQWIDRMFAAHIHDHPFRSPEYKRAANAIIKNEYLD